MDFFEAEGKQVFREFGIPTDAGVLLQDGAPPEDVPLPCVVKAQVLSGKRGKAGGVRVVKDRAALLEAVDQIRSLVIGGNRVAGILLVPVLDIAKEHYLGITLDTINKQIILLYTPFGGMDIEQVAQETPEKLIRMDVTCGINACALYERIKSCGVADQVASDIVGIAEKLYTLYRAADATTVEINPLVESSDGRLTAADAKLVVDDNALFRQPDRTLLPRGEEPTALELEAKKAGLTYVEVDKNGTVGLLGLGAGLGMATLDTVIHYGLKPCDFTDLGAVVNENCIRVAMRLVLQNPKLEAIIFNAFGGMFSTYEMASWFLAAMEELGDRKLTVIVKLRGIEPEAGWELLRKAGIPFVSYGTTDEAVKLLLEKMEVKR